MINILEECQRLLSEAEINTAETAVNSQKALLFEGSTVLGFILAYDKPSDLLEHWEPDSASLINHYRLRLRHADQKAWNTYTILIAQSSPDPRESVALSKIEEDLTGTRKIVHGGAQDVETLKMGLLPLLPIQNGPRLEAVDMKEEIELRTTELPERVVKAFLSGATEATVIQILEEEP